MSTILDHVGLPVSDFARSKAFYTAALGTLGIQLMTDFTFDGTSHAGYGIDRPSFWISSGKQHRGEGHLAFVARSRAEVHAFYTVALSFGGPDNGAPGLRPQYHPNYYGAFVYDPDGYNIEAVCHGTE